MALTKAHSRMIEGAAVNVLDYGAVGDGVTDDTAAIQAAFDTSNDIYIPRGEYKVTTTLSFTGSRRSINCSPKAIIRWSGSTGSSCISFGDGGVTTTNGLSIYDLFVSDDTSGTNNLVVLNNCDRSIFYGLYLSANSLKTAGVGLKFLNNSTINDFVKFKCVGLNKAVQFGNNANAITFFSPQIEQVETAGMDFPTLVTVNKINIIGGTFQGSPNATAILLNYPVNSLNIDGVYFEGFNRFVDVTHAAANNTPYNINNCRFQNPGDTASIFLTSPSTILAKSNSYEGGNLIRVGNASAKFVGEYNDARDASTEINNASSGSVARIQMRLSGNLNINEGGLTFGASTNQLNSYEEGTFTPTVYGTTSAGTGTYTTQTGKYTRIGNVVYFNFYIVWTAHTGTGNIRFGGLPITSSSSPDSSVANIMASGLSYTGDGLVVTVSKGQTNATLYVYSSGALTSVPMDTNASAWVSGHYFVD